MYVWVTTVPVAVEPSPKIQLTVYSGTPPMGRAVNVTREFTSGLVGRNVKLVERGRGVEAPKRSLMVGSLAAAARGVRPQFASIM